MRRVFYTTYLEKNKTDKTLDEETVANIQRRFNELTDTIRRESDEFDEYWGEKEEIHWD